MAATFYIGQIARDEGDKDLALRMLTKAAESGLVYAQYELGELYIAGDQIGVGRDFRRAIHWFAYAAQQGHRESQMKFEQLYYGGYEEKEVPTGFWFEREQLYKQSIPCSVPYAVTVDGGEYIVEDFEVN